MFIFTILVLGFKEVNHGTIQLLSQQKQEGKLPTFFSLCFCCRHSEGEGGRCALDGLSLPGWSDSVCSQPRVVARVARP